MKATFFYLSLIILVPLYFIVNLVNEVFRLIAGTSSAIVNVIHHFNSRYEYYMFNVEFGSFMNDERFKTLKEVWKEGFTGEYVSTYERYVAHRDKDKAEKTEVSE